MNSSGTVPFAPPPGGPPPADLLRRLVESADACFADILRDGCISPGNGRAYRRARHEARLHLGLIMDARPGAPVIRLS